MVFFCAAHAFMELYETDKYNHNANNCFYKQALAGWRSRNVFLSFARYLVCAVQIRGRSIVVSAEQGLRHVDSRVYHLNQPRK